MLITQRMFLYTVLAIIAFIVYCYLQYRRTCKPYDPTWIILPNLIWSTAIAYLLLYFGLSFIIIWRMLEVV